MMREIRVVLVDDHPIYREGVARTLADQSGVECPGAAHIAEAIQYRRSLDSR
mgnify:CR=1 FL=1